jgi:ParB-like chromosome segregation protein Spo0J
MPTNSLVQPISVCEIDSGRRPWHSCPYFSSVQVQRLATSIRSAGGILHPIGLRVNSAGSPPAYEVVWGRRRLLAGPLAEISEVPAVVLNVSDEEAAVLSLAENVARGETPLLQRGWAIADLAAKGNTGVQISRLIGLDEASVSEGKRFGQALSEVSLVAAVAARVPVQRRLEVVEEAANLGKRTLLAIARDLEKGDTGRLEAIIDALGEGKSPRNASRHLKTKPAAASAEPKSERRSTSAREGTPAAEAVGELVKQFELILEAMRAVEAGMRTHRVSSPASPHSPGEDRAPLMRRFVGSLKRLLRATAALFRRPAASEPEA